MLDTPILFLVFNRPDTTKKVFESIRSVQPRQLFIAADGPRSNRAGEKERCNEVREIVSGVDWACEVHTLYREENLGCGMAVSSAISWFFSNVEQGIILEDDTLPDISFFTFSQHLLEKYKHDERIAHINGSNFQLGRKNGNGSYYYSNYPMIWGWATWKRAWKFYEYKMDSWPEISKTRAFWQTFHTEKERRYWQKIFELMYNGFYGDKITYDTWDYQWYYTFWKNGFSSVTPAVNLITNIGFDGNATHTKEKSIVSDLPRQKIVEIVHPEKFRINRKADLILFKNYFAPPPSFVNRVRNISYKIVPESFFSFIRKLKHKLRSDIAEVKR